MRRAAIDVGSNSVLLTIAELDGSLWRPILETTAVTSLGEGTRDSGILKEPNMANTLAALAEAFATAHRMKASTVVAAATMAARIATNAPEFLDRAKQQGTPVVVLTGEEEARLGFLSVCEDPLFAGSSRLTVLDIGGQSTELGIGIRRSDSWLIESLCSKPIGTLALRQRCLSDEAPNAGDLMNAVRQIDCQIPDPDSRPDDQGLFVVLGATGTNLASIRERLTEWNPDIVHGAVLDYEEVGRAVGYLSGLGDEGRAAVVGIEPGREKTIHIGALILERYLFAFGFGSCVVSTRGWRHAMLARQSL